MSQTNKRLTADELLNILALSNNATAVYTTENIIIESANDKMLSAWKKDRSVIGKPIEEAIPELKGQPFIAILQNVWNTGETYKAENTPADIEVDGKLQTFYFDFEYLAIKNSDGITYCILHTSKDVSERVATKKVIEENEKQLRKLNVDLTLANRNLVTSNRELNTLNENLFAAQADTKALLSKISDSENKFRSLVEQIPMAINLFHSRDLIVDIANEKMLELWGRTANEMMGKPLVIAMPELSGQPFLQRLDDVLTTGIAYYSNDEKAFIFRNGELQECYFDIVYHPLVNEDGSITSILQVAIEVTKDILANRQIQNLNEELAATNEELAASNEELRSVNEEMQAVQDELINSNTLITESEERFRTMAEGTNVMIAVDNENNHTTYFNKAWEDITGRSRNYLLTTGWADLIHPDDKEQYINSYLTSFATQTPFTGEFRIKDKSNSYRWLLVHGAPRFRTDGSFAGYISSKIDITEQKKDEQRKNDFIGMVSHELKTPLTSLSGYLELLRQELDGSKGKFGDMLLEKAGNQMNKMTTMINGFLNVSRLESGKLQIDATHFDLAMLMQETKEETLFINKSHQFIFHPIETAFVNADRDKIGQVINNLISNAIKYSPHGTTIQVACVAINNLAQISVKDEGMGISQEDKDKLFDRYYRAKSSHIQSIAGFGIGLYLCAEIIRRHNGEIWVESMTGKGSVFYFTLPLAETEIPGDN